MAFTRAWQETYPDDENFGYELDDYQRQIRVDVRERVGVQHKSYADETGHTDVGEHKPGECNIAFVGAKASFPVPASSNAGCLAVATDENNQLYYWSGSAWTKVQEPVLITGDQTIAGAKTFSGAVVINGATTLNAVSTVKDGSAMSTAAAPTEDAMIANKKYVDDEVAALASLFVPNPMTGANDSNGSVTFPNGLIMKWGKSTTNPTNPTTVTFAQPFPNACFQAFATGGEEAQKYDGSTFDITQSSFKYFSSTSIANPMRWFAIGR